MENPVPAARLRILAEFTSLRSLLKNVREEAEKDAITQTLERTNWNRKAAARLLKVSYRTILYKIEQYHLTSSSNCVSSANGVRQPGALASRGTTQSDLLEVGDPELAGVHEEYVAKSCSGSHDAIV